MLLFRRLPIKYKLIVVVLLTTTIGLTFTGAVYLSYDKIKQRESLIQEMLVLSKVVALRSAVALSFNDRKNAFATISTLSIRKNMRLICMYDQQGEIFVQYFVVKEETACPAMKRLPNEALHLNEDYLDTVIAIVRNNGKIGHLLVRVSLDELKERVDNQILVSIVTLFCSLFLAFLLTSRLQRQIYAPISQLGLVAEQITRKRNYSIRAQTDNEDELGEMVRAFNDMLNEIEQDKEQMNSIAFSLNQAKLTLTSKNAELEAALSEIKLAKNELSKFTSMISHELRTPLTVLQCEVELMVDGIRKPTQENLDSLQEEVVHFTGLINDMFELVLSDARTLKYNKEYNFLDKLLNRSIELFEWKFKEHDIELVVDLSSLKHVETLIDPHRIKQVFDNILNNCLKYTDPKGRLCIFSDQDDTYIWLHFQDTAPGVDEPALSQLFDRFYRVEESRNRLTGGAGLGLSICKTITEDHQGRILARPSPLGGVWISIGLLKNQSS